MIAFLISLALSHFPPSPICDADEQAWCGRISGPDAEITRRFIHDWCREQNKQANRGVQVDIEYLKIWHSKQPPSDLPGIIK